MLRIRIRPPPRPATVASCVQSVKGKDAQQADGLAVEELHFENAETLVKATGHHVANE